MTEDELMVEWLRKRGFRVIHTAAVDVLVWPGGTVHGDEERKPRARDLDKWIAACTTVHSKQVLSLRPKGDELAIYELRACVREWMLGL